MFRFLVSESKFLQQRGGETVSFPPPETYFPGKKRDHTNSQHVPLAVTASTVQRFLYRFELISKHFSCKLTLSLTKTGTRCCCCVCFSHNLMHLWLLHHGLLCHSERVTELQFILEFQRFIKPTGDEQKHFSQR